MAALRRADIRSRSWCVTALAACLVGSAEFVFDATRRWPRPLDFRGIAVSSLYGIFAIALLLAAIHFFRLARRYHHKARQSALQPPTSPPDFSKLQDGSQIVRNLEEM